MWRNWNPCMLLVGRVKINEVQNTHKTNTISRGQSYHY